MSNFLIVNRNSVTMATERLPPEIITDILRRLPSKSLGRFKCVSKHWLALISQPQFIKTHQKTLNRNHHIFLTSDSSLYSVPSDHNKRPTKLRFEPPVSDTVDICHGSSNGLVLVTAKRIDGADSLVILNPTTREFLELSESTRYMYGFGYDSLTDDYKVFTLSYNLQKCIVSVGVYSVRTKTSNMVFGSHYRPYGSLRGVFVNGFLHWIGTKKKVSSHEFVPVIVTFNVADNEFGEMPAPIWRNGVDILSESDCKLFAAGEKLAIFLEDEGEGEVWFMNNYGVRESWTKILAHKIIAGKTLPSYLDYNLIFVQMMLYDNGKLLLARGDRILRYDVEKSRFCASIYFDHTRGMCICSESLVSPRSLSE